MSAAQITVTIESKSKSDKLPLSIAPGNTPADILASLDDKKSDSIVACYIDGIISDLSFPLEKQCTISWVTRQSNEALELIRHDCAHVTAQAVLQLFPDTQVTIGPVIENGFFYDFYRQEPFSDNDLAQIEERMHQLIKQSIAFNREVWQRERAIEHYRQTNQPFKVELVEAIAENQTITFYRQGDFLDLCRGPHMPNTSYIGDAFKLTKVAGSYWRGDHRNAQLQRIYGTAWHDKKALRAYLTFLEEAKARDHRSLGKQMNLYHFQEEAAGMAFWHDHGWKLYRNLQQYMRSRLEKGGYIEVNTPQLVDRKLWEQSGHWSKFRENMYLAENEEGLHSFTSDTEEKERIFALKPMNCPCHVQIFNQGIKSYRDLPLRMSEFGSCHRFEPSGALHGLMRVRNFVQDDAHIFCSEDQILSESKIFCELLISIYKDLGFEQIHVNFADRPETRVGSDEIWQKAEEALLAACKEANLDYTVNHGEGAFYGPKLEFVLKDAIGRSWQCGTLQVDFNLPKRLGAQYTNADGQRLNAVMLHRAILGSFERFIGILIEHYYGKLPLWMAPVQLVITTITSDADAYAQEIYEKAKEANISAILDIRNEKINYKVREHSHMKRQVIWVVGAKEIENKQVSIRRLGSKEIVNKNLTDALESLANECRFPDTA